jgi:hypothetical protein
LSGYGAQSSNSHYGLKHYGLGIMMSSFQQKTSRNDATHKRLFVASLRRCVKPFDWFPSHSLSWLWKQNLQDRTPKRELGNEQKDFIDILCLTIIRYETTM